jgi:hypothetical protein
MQGSFKNVCRVLLSRRPLNGFIEVQDHFSLFPVADFAEVSKPISTPFFDRRLTRNGPDSKFGPPFPVALQVQIPTLVDGEYDLDTSFRKLDIYSNLVCLLFHQLEPFPRTNRDGVWVREWNSDLARMEYRIAQQGFGFDEAASLANYVGAGGRRAAVFTGENYFDSIPYPEEVCIPDFLERFFTNYENLDATKNADFNRASFLFWQAEQIRGFGGDPNPTYVSSVECLTKKQKGETCQTCNAKTSNLNEGYKAFLSNFAASSDVVMKLQKKMYNTRSKSVHGERVFSVDDLSFDSDERFQNDILFPWLTRKGLVNWMIAQTSH